MINQYLNKDLDAFLNDAAKISQWAEIISQPIFKEAISLLSKNLLNQSMATENFNEMAARQLEISGAREAIHFLTDILTRQTQLEETSTPEPTYQENPFYDTNTNITTNPTPKSIKQRKSKQ